MPRDDKTGIKAEDERTVYGCGLETDAHRRLETATHQWHQPSSRVTVFGLLSIHHDKVAAVLAFNLYRGSAQCEKPGQFIREAATNYSFAEYTTQFNGRTPTTA